MTQHFGSALSRPWALVKWNAGGTPNRRPATTVAYLTDAVEGGYLGGLVEFYRKRDTIKALWNDDHTKIVGYETVTPGDRNPRWHFRFKRARRFADSDVVLFFPNHKSRDDGPTAGQIRNAKKLVPKNPTEEAA